MKHLVVMALLLFLAGCAKDPKETPAPAKADTLAVKPSKAEKLYVKDPSLYDASFLKCLEPMPDTLRIIDNYILAQNDTLYFDEALKLNQNYRFTGFTDTHFYQVDIIRNGLTTVQYDYAVMANEKPVYSLKGTAVLNCGFLLGAESADDDKTGDGYFVSDYRDDSNNCGATVSIGEPDDEGRIRAIVNCPCSPKEISRNNHEAVTLRESH
ncbi:MAG: hypothetical protein V4581_01220 [Bacteroidota bacterium]